MSKDHGLYEVARHGRPVVCADSLCVTMVDRGDLCYLDIMGDRVLCKQCGQCLRHARRKAIERGETDTVWEY